MSLLVKKLDPKSFLPTVTNPGEDLGFDLYALEDTALLPNKVCKVKTGISAQYKKTKGIAKLREPENFLEKLCGVAVREENLEIDYVIDKTYGLLFRDRSSMASKGITVSGGVVDSSYTGELRALSTNHNKTSYLINRGDKIVQMIPTEVNTDTEIREVEELPVSNRGADGFGSSGR